MILEELGDRLARIRKQRGYTQDALAQEAGLGVATLRRIEDGKDGKLGTWLRVLKALAMEAAIDTLLPENFRSPMAEAKRSKRRSRRRGKTAGASASFVWGDERP